ncbi:MAG: hypothetical protein M5U26_15945 [Planctomycetota bacterium]|nr:hypothetical protein [Planctomycetota bacterium]
MALREAKFYVYDQVPIADTTWSLSTGPDRRVYAAACIEHRGGCAVVVARYNEQIDALDYLFDVGETCGDPPDSGRATQCKIHYSFAPSERDGILYAATHASAPALNELHFDVHADWGDERKAFRGSVLLAYDTRQDRVLWSRTLIPNEGCRCLCFDEERRLFYAVGWPRNHFLVYDLERDRVHDCGRLGSLNPQAIWLDKKSRAYTTDDYGRILRYDPDRGELEELELWIPRPRHLNGWHGVVYDIAAAPDGESLFGVPWRNFPHLFRHWPLEGAQGRMEDLGPATQYEQNPYRPISFFKDHAGGLVVGPDRAIYFVKSRWAPFSEDRGHKFDHETAENFEGLVIRLDPESGKQEDFAILRRPDGMAAHYVSRGAMDARGDLFFGNIAGMPSGIFRLPMNARTPPDPRAFPLRKWG